MGLACGFLLAHELAKAKRAQGKDRGSGDGERMTATIGGDGFLKARVLKQRLGAEEKEEREAFK